MLVVGTTVQRNGYQLRNSEAGFFEVTFELTGTIAEEENPFEHGVLYLKLCNRTPNICHTTEINRMVLDFDKKRRLVGIEFLDLSIVPDRILNLFKDEYHGTHKRKHRSSKKPNPRSLSNDHNCSTGKRRLKVRDNLSGSRKRTSKKGKNRTGKTNS